MKKIAQGRDRRRQRQLEAAERQAAFLANLAKYYEKPGKDVPKDVQMARDAHVAKLRADLAKAEERLANLKAGNYPQ